MPRELCRELGYRPSEIDDLVEAWFALIHPSDTERVASAVDDVLCHASGHINFRHRMLQKNGEVQWVDTSAAITRNDDGQPVRLAGTKRMISSNTRTEVQTYSSKNSLNREEFLFRLSERLTNSASSSYASPQVFVLKLTQYDEVKAALGNQAAHQLVREFSRHLKHILPQAEGESLARLDESHLAVLSNQDRIEQCAQAVRKLIKRPFRVFEHDLFVTITMGVNSFGTSNRSSEEIVREALVAASEATKSHTEQPTRFENRMDQKSLERFHLETDLRFAVQNQEFELHYQPIISLSCGSIIGFEALIRWNSPARGYVSPDQFIPLAEETGLINPIGEWVLCEAVNELERLHASGLHSPNLSISVNLSACQFFQPSLLRTLKHCLANSSIKPSQLILEITESVLLDNNDEAAKIFNELRTIGVRLHMDDFGTGYSSLSLLRSCPVDKLKIDRSFVRSLADNEADQAIVRAIMTMTHSLGKNVIAEGIETPEQLQYLRSLGCSYGQGHYFAKPIPAPSSWVKQAANTPKIGLSVG